MRINGRWVGMLALAALTASCSERSVTGTSDRGGATPRAPRLTVGATTTVSVACPTKMETGTSGPCVAFGYDSNGKFASSTVTAWSSSNTSVATVSGGTVSAVAGGSTSISATVGGVTGSTTVNVVWPVAVTIGGPIGSIRPNVYCEYYASASGGSAPYTYSWSQTTGNGIASGDYYLARSSSSFTLTVQVTDSNGQVGYASKNVTVSSGAQICPL